jgi:D-alanyl-D-alanine carboxypeptidase/D-alanyl-D-alanine-endopeptidase (penicillin-binding protein 4)
MKSLRIILEQLLIINSSLLILASCSLSKQISKSAEQLVLRDSSCHNAHIGISIFEPARNKYWYNFNGDHYFVPASNTKIPTCYAAMRYLGDSLTGILKTEGDSALIILPAADPTLLHPDFKNQPVIRLLQTSNKKIYISDLQWHTTPLGSGWSWNAYNDPDMAERSPMPVYGNVVKWIQDSSMDNEPALVYSIPEVNWKVDFTTNQGNNFHVERSISENVYIISEGKGKLMKQNVPFVTNGLRAALELLPDTIHKPVELISAKDFQRYHNTTHPLTKVKTQATDSLLKPMMHRSDNFFAEQTLLMVSNQLLGVMNDQKIIDTLLKTDFKDLPEKPRWADGSGLSRYNLFSPQDFVIILNKMKNEFGMDRIKLIFPTGNEGTLTNYYKAENGYMFAKTGTLSGVVCLSGFLYTKKNTLLIFSVLVNNHNSSATAVRRAVEKFIEGIRNHF